ncbi:MAG: transporter [Methylobacterium sp.]|nr:MAG: transporter [Methylobacterium sp.]
MVFKDARFHGEKRAQMLPVVAVTEARVATLLASAPDLDGSSITVTAMDDGIVLAGFVTSEGELRRAAELAQAVEGVAFVDNRIALR